MSKTVRSHFALYACITINSPLGGPLSCTTTHSHMRCLLPYGRFATLPMCNQWALGLGQTQSPTTWDNGSQPLWPVGPKPIGDQMRVCVPPHTGMPVSIWQPSMALSLADPSGATIQQHSPNMYPLALLLWHAKTPGTPGSAGNPWSFFVSPRRGSHFPLGETDGTIRRSVP